MGWGRGEKEKRGEGEAGERKGGGNVASRVFFFFWGGATPMVLTANYPHYVSVDITWDKCFKQALQFQNHTKGRQIWPPHRAAKGPATPLPIDAHDPITPTQSANITIQEDPDSAVYEWQYWRMHEPCTESTCWLSFQETPLIMITSQWR